MTAKLEKQIFSRVDMRHLRLIVAIAEYGTILKAAHHLATSQPTATKVLQDLEADLGTALFERTNRGMTPTQIGAALVRHAQLTLANWRHSAEDIADLVDGMGGHVRVGTLLAASAQILPVAIAGLRTTRPKVVVEVVEGTNDRLLPMLMSGDIDFVIGRLPDMQQAEGLRQHVLYTESVSCVVRRDHPLTSRKHITLTDLVDEQWILPPPDTLLRGQIEATFAEAGLHTPALAVQSVSVLTNRWLLLHTDMIGIWPESMWSEDPMSQSLFCLPINFAKAASAIGLLQRDTGGLAPAAKALVDCLELEAQRHRDV